MWVFVILMVQLADPQILGVLLEREFAALLMVLPHGIMETRVIVLLLVCGVKG